METLPFIDPFGAPEIFVDGVAYREAIGTENIRSVFYSRERGENIVRLKLIVPVAVCTLEHKALRDFISAQRVSTMRRMAS